MRVRVRRRAHCQGFRLVIGVGCVLGRPSRVIASPTPSAAHQVRGIGPVPGHTDVIHRRRLELEHEPRVLGEGRPPRLRAMASALGCRGRRVPLERRPESYAAPSVGTAWSAFGWEAFRRLEDHSVVVPLFFFSPVGPIKRRHHQSPCRGGGEHSPIQPVDHVFAAPEPRGGNKTVQSSFSRTCVSSSSGGSCGFVTLILPRKASRRAHRVAVRATRRRHPLGGTRGGSSSTAPGVVHPAGSSLSQWA